MGTGGDPFAPLREELDRWAADGRQACFWWRDDDAVEATPALDRLRALTAAAGVPVGLAVVPAVAVPSLVGTLRDWPLVEVLCHGHAHRNWAAPDDRKAELGADRPAAEVAAELVRGRDRLADLTDGRARPVLVPPWNRIDPGVVARLSSDGWRGLSIFGPRRVARREDGLIVVNTHVDIIDWAARRGHPPAQVAMMTAARLRAQRNGLVDPDEPIGLLTHHLVHDAAAWDSCAGLVSALTVHVAARWVGPSVMFEVDDGG